MRARKFSVTDTQLGSPVTGAERAAVRDSGYRERLGRVPLAISRDAGSSVVSGPDIYGDR